MRVDPVVAGGDARRPRAGGWPSFTVVIAGATRRRKRRGSRRAVNRATGASDVWGRCNDFKADAPAELSAPSRGDVASSFADSANENEIDEAGPSTLAPINLQNRAAGIISAAYVAGVLMMMLYWALALVRLKQLRRGARPASAEVQREFARITGGNSDRASLLTSDDSRRRSCGACGDR